MKPAITAITACNGGERIVETRRGANPRGFNRFGF
jgi:hypothetical protein